MVDKLASCGERIETQAEMRRHVCWAIGFDRNTGYSTIYGDLLLAKLQSIYTKIDDEAAASESRLAVLRAMPQEVDTTKFYAMSGTQSHTRHPAAATGNSNVLQDTDTGVVGNSSDLQGQRLLRGTRHQRVMVGGRASHPRGRVVTRGVVGSRRSSQGWSLAGDETIDDLGAGPSSR